MTSKKYQLALLSYDKLYIYEPDGNKKLSDYTSLVGQIPYEDRPIALLARLALEGWLPQQQLESHGHTFLLARELPESD